MNTSKNFTVSSQISILDIVEISLLKMILYLTITCNMLVILILLFKKKKQPYKFLNFLCIKYNKISRMSFYLMILSFADITVALVSILPQIYWKERFNSINPFFCKAITFFQVFAVYLSTFTLILIAHDRYLCICKPLESVSWTYRVGMRRTITAIFLSIVISFPQLIIFNIGKH